MLTILQFYSKYNHVFDMKKKRKLASEPNYDLLDTAYWNRKVIAVFGDRKNKLDFFDCSNKSGFLELNMDGFFLKEKSPFKIVKVSLSSKLDRGSYIMFVVETTFKYLEYFLL